RPSIVSAAITTASRLRWLITVSPESWPAAAANRHLAADRVPRHLAFEELLSASLGKLRRSLMGEAIVVQRGEDVKDRSRTLCTASAGKSLAGSRKGSPTRGAPRDSFRDGGRPPTFANPSSRCRCERWQTLPQSPPRRPTRPRSSCRRR